MPASEAAKAHFELANLERSPVRARALHEMGQIHMARGDIDSAEGVFEILFRLRIPEENRLEWAYGIAVAFEEKGEENQALEYFELVGKADPSYRDAVGQAKRLLKGDRGGGYGRSGGRPVRPGARGQRPDGYPLEAL